MDSLALKAFETAKKAIPFERSIKTIIGENTEYPISTARNSFIHSYLGRFFVEKAFIPEYYELSERDKAEFRKEVRRLALVEFDRIAKEPVEIPEYLINDAIKLLEKAGYEVKKHWTIQDLARGKVAVHFDTKNVSLLQRCIKEAFPEETLLPSGDFTYYFEDKDQKGAWYFSNEKPDLPIQSLRHWKF